MAATTEDRSISNSMTTSKQIITRNYESLELITAHSYETQDQDDRSENDVHVYLFITVMSAPLFMCCSQPIIQSFPFFMDHKIMANVALFLILAGLGLTLTCIAYTFGQGREYRVLGLEAKCTVSFMFVVIGSLIGLDAVSSTSCDTYTVMTFSGLLGFQLQFHCIGKLVWRFVDINVPELMFDCFITMVASLLGGLGGVARVTAFTVPVGLVLGGVKRWVYLRITLLHEERDFVRQHFPHIKQLMSDH